MRKIAFTALAGALALAASAADAASGKLVLYTSQPDEDARLTVDAFKAATPGVEVEWIRNGTERIMAILRTEIAAGAPKPDLLLIADTVTMEELKRENRLLAHAKAPVAPYDKALYDPAMTYFSTKLITTGIMYHAKATKKPTSWSDLAAADALNQVSMPSPLTSGAALIHISTLIADPAFGWAYFEKLAANKLVPQGGNAVTLKAVSGGEKMYGMVVDYLPIREKAKGAPVEFVFPKEGVSYVTEPVAILSTAKNPDAAKAFVDFLLSRPGQELASKQGYLPAHPDVAPPPGFPPLRDIKLMKFDPERTLRESEATKKRFATLFGL